jgi:hypothetical protein
MRGLYSCNKRESLLLGYITHSLNEALHILQIAKEEKKSLRKMGVPRISRYVNGVDSLTRRTSISKCSNPSQANCDLNPPITSTSSHLITVLEISSVILHPTELLFSLDQNLHLPIVKDCPTFHFSFAAPHAAFFQ